MGFGPNAKMVRRKHSTARRHFVLALGVAALAVPLALLAQQPARVPQVGLALSETPSAQASRTDALGAGLRERGYIERKNFAMELRSAGENYDRLGECVGGAAVRACGRRPPDALCRTPLCHAGRGVAGVGVTAKPVDRVHSVTKPPFCDIQCGQRNIQN